MASTVMLLSFYILTFIVLTLDLDNERARVAARPKRVRNEHLND
jgi:hypothetical protein